MQELVEQLNKDLLNNDKYRDYSVNELRNLIKEYLSSILSKHNVLFVAEYYKSGDETISKFELLNENTIILRCVKKGGLINIIAEFIKLEIDEISNKVEDDIRGEIEEEKKEKTKEQITDFESVEADLQNSNVNDFYLSMNFYDKNSPEYFEKRIDRGDAPEIIKGLIKLKNTESFAPIKYLILKDLQKLINELEKKIKKEQNLQEQIKLMRKIVCYNNIRSIYQYEFLNYFYIYKVQYLKYDFDYNGARIYAEKLIKENPEDDEVKNLYTSVADEINSLQNKYFNTNKGLSFFSNLFNKKKRFNRLKEKAKKLFDEPKQLIELLFYIDKHIDKGLVTEIVIELYKYSIHTDLEKNNYRKKLIYLNVAIFLRPEVSLFYSTRGIFRIKSGYIFDAREDLINARKFKDDSVSESSVNNDIEQRLFELVSDIFIDELELKTKEKKIFSKSEIENLDYKDLIEYIEYIDETGQTDDYFESRKLNENQLTTVDIAMALFILLKKFSWKKETLFKHMVIDHFPAPGGKENFNVQKALNTIYLMNEKTKDFDEIYKTTLHMYNSGLLGLPWDILYVDETLTIKQFKNLYMLFSVLNK